MSFGSGIAGWASAAGALRAEGAASCNVTSWRAALLSCNITVIVNCQASATTLWRRLLQRAATCAVSFPACMRAPDDLMLLPHGIVAAAPGVAAAYT